MMTTHLVILIGPPACGKGTQARILKERFGWRTFSTGAAIRRHVHEETPLGLRCREQMAAAYLLPDDLIIEVVRQELADHQGGLVLDGFPRTLVQGRLFDEYCAERSWTIHAVVVFDATRQDLVERVTRRLSCHACGGTFRLGQDGVTEGGSCPHCEGTLERRADDTPEVFDQRFTEYERLTLPLLDHYGPRGLVHHVPALDPANLLAVRIIGLLEGQDAPS